MRKPDEIPQDVWDAAYEASYTGKLPVVENVARAILAAKAEEREACASLADATADELDRDNQILHSLVGRGLALAMRKRGS